MGNFILEIDETGVTDFYEITKRTRKPLTLEEAESFQAERKMELKMNSYIEETEND